MQGYNDRYPLYTLNLYHFNPKEGGYIAQKFHDNFSMKIQTLLDGNLK